MTQNEKVNRNYIGYEYKEIRADSFNVSLYLDSYESFGWKMDENTSIMKENGESIIRIKRDRKIINKQELTRLQRNFEDCIKQISLLEKSKSSGAIIASITVGVLGTACMAGAVFAYLAATPMIWLCILLAIPGFAGWIFPLFLFQHLIRKKGEKINPLIEEKYDEIYEICKKGNKLIGNY